ncbi:MAG TPA: c-type cytochrome [Methylophilaceae bacterium]|nr:c-type cytochrome [Methylophilaceae bacterium]
MSFRISIMLLTLLTATASLQAAEEQTATPKIATQVCASCHGADGNSAVPMYPKLAGQFNTYTAKQLKEFKSGVRKSPVMTPIAATLSEEDINALSLHFNKQEAKLGKAKVNGPASRGAKIYQAGIPDLKVPACASCHGPAGAGIPAQFPKLAGQHSEYTLNQLKLFRSGERENDPAKMMRMIASRMSDQDMAAVADYIQGLR